MQAHVLAPREGGKRWMWLLILHSGRQALPAGARVEKWLLGGQLTVSFIFMKFFVWIQTSHWLHLLMCWSQYWKR